MSENLGVLRLEIDSSSAPFQDRMKLRLIHTTIQSHVFVRLEYDKHNILSHILTFIDVRSGKVICLVNQGW